VKVLLSMYAHIIMSLLKKRERSREKNEWFPKVLSEERSQ
jgi:hypothetical protein